MRISLQEREIILAVLKPLDPNAEIFLFGSRVNDALKGGDLDILVMSETLAFSEKITATALLKQRLGEQKIDLIIASREKATHDPFLRSIRADAVQIG